MLGEGDRMKKGGGDLFWHEGSFPWLLNYIRGGGCRRYARIPFFLVWFGKDGAFVLLSPDI